jgi:hypothetical protein
MPAHSTARSDRSSQLTPPDHESRPPDELSHEAVTQPSLSHDFSRISIHPPNPALEAQALGFTTQSRPLALASPRACPTRVQAKLTISQPGDEYEQEADRVAEQIMDTPHRKASPPTAQQLWRPDDTDSERNEAVLPRAGRVNPAADSSIGVPYIIREVLNSPGQPLDVTTRIFFEARFGYDFSQVRVHSDPKAADSARRLNALAYAAGRDVVFGAGQYAPGTGEGRRLIGHELTHVIQQDQALNEANTGITLSSHWRETEADPVVLLSTFNRQVPVVERAPSGTVQLRPRGTVQTSRGVEEIEGSTITSSARAIRDRLATQEGNINIQIQSWTEDGVGDLRDGIQDAAISFRNWYASRARRPNTAAFISNLVWAVGGALSAVFPPASVAATVAGVAGGAGGVAATILGRNDPNAEPDAQVRQVEQDMIRFSSTMDRRFDNFGTRLKAANPDIWNSIGIAITMDPPLLENAQQILFQQAGVPHPNRPYAEQVLARMIFAYIDWERMWELQQSRFFISTESVEYALYTEDVRRRLQREAEAEAQRRLGNP